MTIGIVLGTFAVAMGLLASNRVRIDLIGLMVLAILGVTRILPTAQLFKGFSSEAVILIAGMLALGEGLVASGATQRLAALMRSIGGAKPQRLSTVLMLAAALPSAFISDVGLVGMFIPVVRDLYRATAIPVRRLLMPLAVAATLGGLLTMVGSAGTIVGNTALRQAGYAPLGLFAITPLAAILTLVGIAAIALLGSYLIPGGTQPAPLESQEEPLRAYMSELRVLPDSPLVGKPLKEIPVFSAYGLTVARIVRQGTPLTASPNAVLAPGDALVVVGDVSTIVEADNERLGLSVTGDDKSDPQARQRGEATIVEVLIGHRSPWAGRTVVALDLRRRLGLTVLGLFRDGHLVYQQLSRIPLHVGDIVLVQGTPEEVQALHQAHGLIILNQPALRLPAPRHAVWMAPAILLAILLLSALNVFDIQTGIVIGVALMAATGILRLSDAYRAIEWRIIVFVAGMIPLGQALINTGITATVVTELAHLAHQVNSPMIIVGILFFIAALLTQVLSNIATVLVLGPVAAQLAGALRLHPYPLVMAIIVAVSASPLTPLANKADVLVMGPGGYRYSDFLRLGVPMTIIMGVLATFLIPVFFPFR